MTKFTKNAWIYITVFFVFTLAAVALRTSALIFEFETGQIYFSNKTLITISGIVCAIFVPTALSYIFITQKDMKLYASFKTAGTYIPSGIVSVALLFLGGELFAKNFVFREEGAKYFSNAASVISILTTLLAIVCALNFFFNVFHEKKESLARATFCLLCALFLGCYAGYLYFSDELPINAPNKAVDQLAYLGLAIFFLYETRISLGRAKWRLYFAFGLISAALAYYSAIPAIIYFFTDSALISNSLAENVLTLTMAVYVTARVSMVAGLAPDEMCETAKAISEMAEKRSADIENHERLRGVLNLVDADDPVGIKETDIGANYEIEIPMPEPASDMQESFNFDEI